MTHLELELGELLVEIDRVVTEVACFGAFQSFLGANLEFLALDFETTFEQVEMRIEIRLNSVCGAILV